MHYFFEVTDSTYGYRSIHADLAAEQTECSPQLVKQVMRQIDLVPASRGPSGSRRGFHPRRPRCQPNCGPLSRPRTMR
ncbi:transposase [Cryobacterium sp. TMT2-14]|nr:transposase [Cryobacterium sp. TMT2-14]